MFKVVPNASSSDLDPYAADVLLDPYPFYEYIRDLGAAVHLPSRDIWFVAGYDDAVSVLRNHEEFVSGDGVTYRGARHRERFPLLESDPPEHTRIRRSVQPSFARKAIEALRPGIHSAAAEITRAVLTRGEVDGVTDIAEQMPDRAMKLLTGLTPPDCQTLVAWGDAVVRAEEPEAESRYSELLAAGLTWLASEGVAAMPTHCMGRQIMESGGARGGLEEGQERLMTLASIWLAGVESTAALLGNAINTFVDHPDQWNLLRARPDLVPNAVEELLRYEAPFRLFYRRTRAAVQIGDTQVPAGALIAVGLAAAGRDPRQFPNPNQFDITRENARAHVSFSTAVHQCLGSPLARLEAVTMLGEMSKYVERFERTAEPIRDPSGTVRKFQSLPVRLVPSGGGGR